MKVTLYISTISLSYLLDDYLASVDEPVTTHEIPYSFGKTSLHNVGIIMTIAEYITFKQSQEKIKGNDKKRD